MPESIRKELAALAAKPEGDIDFSDYTHLLPPWYARMQSRHESRVLLEEML